MVLMGGASDHRATPKPAPPTPAPPPLPSPSPAPAARTRLHGFSFPTLRWGTHRLLRCSNDAASASASPPPQTQTQKQTQTPSLAKEKPHPHGQQGSPGAPAATQPWNLRSRRSPTVAPRSEGAGKAAQTPLASPTAAARKRRFSAALTKEEIAEDFAAIRGTRPPRRPKRLPRAVQRPIDLLYPGSSLADVILDSYKIEER